MNKIFKVIWSKSKQCYIVVSEMAKNHSGKKKIVVASILATMAVGSGAITNMVDAAGEVSQGGGNPKTPGSIAIGYGSVSDGTVIHNDGSTTVQPSIAIGVGAKSMGNSSVSVGQGAQVLGYSYSVAVGRSSEANGDYGVSVGYNTRAKLHGIAMGEQARAMKEGATTFGVSSRGYGNGSIAIGWQSLAGANVYDEDGKPGPDINQDPEKTISDYNKWGDTAIGIRAVATGGNALALGRSATAKAANAVAIGGGNGSSYTDNTEKTEATAEKAVAIGYKTEASAVSSVALGTSAVSGGENGVAIGNDAQAQTANTIAVGSSSRAENANDSAFGNAAKATGGGATAIGYTVTTSGNQAFGAGSNSEVSGAGAVGIGYKVKASGNRAISIGNDNDSIQTEATGEKAIAIGSGVKATGSVSIAMGRNAQSLREYTTAIGTNVIASNKASGSTIIGYNSFTKGNQSVNIGSTNETLEEAQYSTAIGYDVRAKAKNAIAIGSSGETSEKVIAAGQDAIAIGTSTQGNAVASTAIGKKAIASSENSIAFGTSAKGVGTSATAIGNGATTAKANAIALGTSAQGTGESSTAIGNGAQATNSHAFAAGTSASATGETSTAVGNSASAAGARAVAVGTNTSATQEEGVAVGLRAKAKGIRSVSVGIDTESTTSDGISVGYLSKSQGLGAIAIGRNAVVSGDKSVAVGYDLTVTDTGSTNIGYTSSVAGNQAVSVGARNTVEAGASAGAALGYFVNLSGKNAIGIGAGVNDTNRVTASGDNSAAIGTLAKATAASAMALGSNANAALAHSVALGEGSTTTEADGAGKTAYLSGESTNNSGNGVISVGNKRNDSDRTATITRRIVSVAGGTDDYDAVNIKQLKALEKNEWLLRTQNAGDANPTDVEPQTVNNQTKKRVTLKAGDNIAISNSNGVVTLNVTNVVKTVTSGNTAALTVNNNNGAVTITPNVASSVGAANEDNKLVTSGKVKAALDDKIDKTAEMHIKSGEYTVNTDGTASLIQQNGNNQDQTTRVTIKDIAKKSVLDTLQSDYNTFKMKAITFTGDDNQGVARTLDTTLTVKGGANYTSTTTNTNIRVEKDAANGANGLLVKLSDKLSGMKEIAGTGSQDLVIKNGNTTVTVKAPANGDKGTVDFGDAKVIAKNLDASIAYKAGNGDTKKTVKLQDGFNFTAATDTAADTDVPKSGLAITTGTNGVVTFGLDKATREKVDNAADKNLSNLSDTGKDKVKELAKTAAQDAVKVANGINTTVEKDTATAGVTTYKVNANDTTVAVTGNGLAITGGELGTDKVRKYSLDLSAATKGKLAAVGNLATNVIGGTTIAADGTVTGPTFSITKVDGTAENAGTIKEAIEKLDAANKGQNTKISDTVEKVTNLATALGGGAKVENGTFTGPTYNITKADGTGTETASNVGEAITKLDTRITTANGTLVTKGLDFTGNDTTNAGKVHRDLGTTLTIKGAENFTRAAAENNIKVVKNGDALDVKLAENLAKMKEISGDGTSDLVFKNGDTKVTVKAPTSGDKGTVDFGDAKVVASNLDANIAYKANKETAKKTVKLQDGFNFTAATDTAADTNVPKSGLAITTGTNGVVTFGLDKATREKVDNAADKNLSNLSDTGKTTVKELAKGAAQDAVKVADGINTTVEKDTTTTAGVTTYKVNANDTTVAVTGDGLAIKGGDLGTDKVRKYSLDLSDTVKAKLNAINNVGDTASNGRDGVNGASGAKGLTGKDGLNDKTLTDKVNALRNGEAGSVVYTDENGARLVKAKDGEYYKAADVDKDGNVLNGAPKATTVEARVVNPDGTTTGGTTKLSNIADGKVAAGSKDAVNGGQLNTVKTDLANALGGGAKVENGTFTGPTYNITKDDGSNTTEDVNNVGDAISKLDGRINNANTALGNKGLDFYGNKDAADTDKVHRNLGEALKVKGAENFTREANAKNNIDVVKNAAGDGFDVKLAENLGNIKSISNATGAGKPGSTITLGADGVSIANTTTGADGAAGATKTVTIGKDGINAGGMKITNVTKAEADGDAANKKYVDDAISNLGNIVSGNATLNFAGNVTKDAQDQVTEKVGLSLATGTLHVNGANNEITTIAKGDTITVGLAETVKAQLAKVGDTSSNGRDGKDGTSGAKGLTGKDGLNDKTLTDKVNALRNGEAGSVVYTNEAGDRVVKAKDGQYYKATDVDATGNVLNGATKATTVEARVVNPDGTTTGGTTKLSNIADGKVAAGSKDAVNGGQLHTTKSEIGAIIGGTTINENGKITGPTFSITNAAGTKDDVTTIKDAIEKLDATNAAQNTKISETTEKLTNLGDTVTNNYNDLSKKITDGSTNITNTLTTKGLDFTGNDTTAKVHRDLGTTLTIKGADNFTRTATETNNIKVVKTDNDLDVKLAENLGNIKSISNATGAGKPGSTITLGADGVSIANTAAGADGAAGETKTVTIGKDGINAGGMKITNVAKATDNGDAANKEYVDDAIKNLNTTVTNNANLRYAGDTNEGAAAGENHLNLPLATGTLKVAGTADQIKTVASNGTITLSLAEKVKNKLDKLGDTAADGRDGKAANGQAGDAGNAGDKGATGKDGLNGTNLTDKVNALRNGEAGSVVYTDENGERLVKANNGNYYKTTDVDKTGNVVNNAQPATTVEARVVNPNGETTAPTTLSNIADGKVAANSKDAVNGGQLHTAKSEIGAIIGGTTINENGKITGPTFSITDAEGTAENAGTIKEAIEKLDAANKGQNTKISETAGKVTTLEGKVDGIVDKGMTFAGDDATADKVTRKLGETLNIHGQNNITVKKDGTAADTLNVKLASDLKNITSITNADADGKPGSKITLGADGVSIANTAAGADGAAGETKTVTIGKDGINAGGMKITNVAKATDNGDAANKEYVDDAIKNLNTTVTNNANLRYAGDTNEGAAAGENHLNLPLATGTLKVAGTADQIKTVANNGTITLSLAEKVTNKLDKLGDTASNGRDGKDGTSGAQGLTGKDGLNDKTLTDKVNALRNGEAGSVVYTNDAGDRVVKAKDGKYYKADEVKADGTVKTAEENNGKAPEEVKTPQARVVNPNGKTTVPTTLSNVADGKVAADSKEAVNGGQLNTVKSDLATALGGGAKVENGTFTGPTYNITKDDGTGTEPVKNVGDAISKLDGRINNANTTLATKGLDFTGNDTTDAGKVHRNLGETLTIKGAENFTRAATETNNIKVVKIDNDLDVKLAENLGNIKSISNTTGEGKSGSTITLGADGVSIANTAAGADGAAGETKTVTIGKDGINAGGMKVTNVAKAEADEDAANKKYVDDAITNLNTTVTNNANLRYAGDTNEGAAAGEDHLNLPLATGTLKVAGTADQIKTVANNGTITLSLDEKVANKLNKLGDTAADGRDGKAANGQAGDAGNAGDKGATGKDGLNGTNLTDKVNALRNGEAGSVVYTDENGERLVKANNGKYYKTADVDKTGNVLNNAQPATTVEARVVNPDGTTTGGTTKLSNIADGKVAVGSKDAVNGGQLNTVKSDLATALGGGAKVENGVFTGPTYNITKDDGSNTTEAVNNVGDAISKLDGRINNANTVLGNKGLDFYGNKDTADTDKVHRNLGEALKVKGAENFTREANAKNNIDVVKNTAGDGFDVKLAENLGNIKEIAGNGKDNLVIKNGDATITLKPKKEAEGTNPATPATVDFGDTKVVASNLDASIKYRANDEVATNAKSVKLADGFNFVASTDATTTAEGPKSGLAITAEDNGKVTFGLDKATREKVDNAADKNLSNLSDDGKNKVKELAGEAAKAAVTVADGINTTVTTDTATTGVTTYKVNANDTTVAVNADSLAIAGGDLDATTKVRAYTLDLSDTVKAKLNAINNVGDTASNGRDGVNGTSGATGLTGKDGLNDKTLTDKVNALRNGEAGSVVYTNDAGDRVVKAKDGKYYKADEVKADGTVKTAEENNGKKPEEVKTPQARVVNPNGETTAPTTLSNIADGKVAANSKDAVNGGQLHTVKSDLATALGGDSKVNADGSFTGPTYNITKDDGTGTEPVKNVGDAISKLDGRINNANTVLGNKGLDFYGNKDAADTDKVHRNLGEALKVKGAENFTREANAKNNIDVVKNAAGDGFDVKLAENLGNIKEIAGNGKDNLVIKNGDATITLKPKKEAEGTNPATPATVDFGNAKVVAPNLEASITYRANSAEDANAKTVTLQKGLNFVSGDGTAATAEAAKAGITIAADKDGKVVFGLNEATRNAIDNAADKNLSNLSQDGKDKVADLAKTAARDAVKVTAGNNVTVTSETKDGNTTYTVNGRDTTVKAADNGSVSVTGGTLNAKGEREYTVDLTADAKAELGKISDLNTRLGSAEGKITTLQGDMTKAKDDIAANTKAIDSNKEAIAANKNAIADNARDIAANRKDIDANKQGIAENKKQIGENAKAIAKNAEDIKKNVEDTKKNTQDIKKNADAIKANTDRIQTVENRVTTAEGKIATNEKAIKDNASAIQSNTKAIGANTTAIAKNANDITKANKEIESLKGNSATKDLNNLTNTGKDTITNLINVTGEHGITVTPSTDTTTRVKTFTAKLNDTVTFGSGDKKITVDGTTGTVTSKAVAADTVKANTVNAKTVQLGDSTGTNTIVTADGIAVTTKNPDGTTSKVEIKNGTVSGLTNTKWDPAKVVTEADRSVVATQGQVKDVTDTLARGRVFVGDTGNTVTVGLGDTLAIKGGSTKALTDDNIGVVSTEAKDGKPATMTVKLAKDVKMKDGSTSYDYYLPEIKTNPDGSKEIVKNADGSVKHQLGKDGNPIRLVTTTVNGEGITIAPVKGLDKPTVSLTADGLDNGGNQIHNVAAGTANTDAATVGQVRAAAHALNNRVNEAGAHAAALAAMNPLSYDPLKKSQVMAGVGSYKGNKALALGVAHYANEDTLFNVGVAVGDGSNMVNAGVTYRFGGEYSAVPERYKGGPISSVYVMQDEVSALKAENAEMKEQMKMLMERIEMLAKK